MQVMAGRFMLDGQEVELPVGEGDSLAMKVEALRMLLEERLGTHIFLQCAPPCSRCSYCCWDWSALWLTPTALQGPEQYWVQ